MKNINLWQIGFIALIVGILLTAIPIILAFQKRIKLNKPKFWFKEAEFFGEHKERLVASEGRIHGTLIYWKNQAAAHRMLHHANIFWGANCICKPPGTSSILRQDRLLGINIHDSVDFLDWPNFRDRIYLKV